MTLRVGCSVVGASLTYCVTPTTLSPSKRQTYTTLPSTLLVTMTRGTFVHPATKGSRTREERSRALMSVLEGDRKGPNATRLHAGPAPPPRPQPAECQGLVPTSDRDLRGGWPLPARQVEDPRDPTRLSPREQVLQHDPDREGDGEHPPRGLERPDEEPHVDR